MEEKTHQDKHEQTEESGRACRQRSSSIMNACMVCMAHMCGTHRVARSSRAADRLSWPLFGAGCVEADWCTYPPLGPEGAVGQALCTLVV